MGNIWLKIKIWTKTIVAAVLVIYALIFVLKNSGQSVEFWWWYNHTETTSMLVLILAAFLAGVIATILVWMTRGTIRQIRELKQKSRLEKLERDQAELKAKAAMLQTKTATIPPPEAKP